MTVLSVAPVMHALGRGPMQPHGLGYVLLLGLSQVSSPACADTWLRCAPHIHTDALLTHSQRGTLHWATLRTRTPFSLYSHSDIPCQEALLPGSLHHPSWMTPHTRPPPRVEALLTSVRLRLLTQGFSPCSPLQCGGFTHPPRAITPHTWPPLHGMFFCLNSSCYHFARLPPSWNTFPVPVTCLRPSLGSSPVYVPSWHFAGFLPDHPSSFNAHTVRCQCLLCSPHQELPNWRVQEKKGRGRRERRKRILDFHFVNRQLSNHIVLINPWWKGKKSQWDLVFQTEW